MSKAHVTLTSVLAATLVVGCGSNGGNAGYSTLSHATAYQQSAAKLNNKIDILWVVDNSNSMSPLQQSLVSNFSTFISNFQSKGFDYNMSVTTTDAYLSEANFLNDPSLAQIRDGYGSSHSGYNYITPYIPNVVNNFVTNTTQGAGGSGDERAFQSMLDALKSPLNMGMRRPGAYFAIVVLSDEDDFTDYNRPEGSWEKAGGIADHDYTNPGLPSVDSVIAQLDKITGSAANARKYNVSAITVSDQTCQDQHIKVSPQSVIGARYMEAANKTGGIIGSICDSSYSKSLNFIQQRIVELATQFTLDRQPNVSTIRVSVDGSLVAQDSVNGWTYAADTNSITFHGSSVPQASADVSINYDPANFL